MGRGDRAGTLVFLPAAATLGWFVLLAIAWLGLVGLVVPVALLERVGTVAALRRAIELGRADSSMRSAGSPRSRCCSG